MTGQILPLLVVVVLIGAASLWYRRANGRARTIDATFGADDIRALGLPQGAPALLLFTAPGCPPCTVARRVVDDVGGRRGIPVVVADVTDHPGIATTQHVYRAPTVFVVDERGHAVARVSGVPHTAELEDLLTPAQPAAA